MCLRVKSNLQPGLDADANSRHRLPLVSKDSLESLLLSRQLEALRSL